MAWCYDKTKSRDRDALFMTVRDVVDPTPLGEVRAYKQAMKKQAKAAEGG